MWARVKGRCRRRLSRKGKRWVYLPEEVGLMFGLGPLEITVVVVVIVLLFGAGKIRSLLRGAGEGVREFKDAIKDPDEDDAKSADAADDGLEAEADD
jgi:sec-independent protein translocase protein TatA